MCYSVYMKYIVYNCVCYCDTCYILHTLTPVVVHVLGPVDSGEAQVVLLDDAVLKTVLKTVEVGFNT
jgi:hypothetical protein